MEKLAFKVITNEVSVDFFLEKFKNYVGIKLPLEYAINNQVVGIFLHDQLVGGYILATQPQFRSLTFVPDKVKSNSSFFRKEKIDMMEVNGLWIGPQVKTAKLQFLVWMHLMLDILKKRKSYILLMSDARNKNIDYIHSLTMPIRIYEGPPILRAGEESHETVRVSYTTRYNIAKNLPRYLMEYRSRSIRSEVSSTLHTYA
ncbi:MAG: hypothetical protein RLZZ385_484 [Pseudomonadota bacterium]|jgi:hypothetical protein